MGAFIEQLGQQMGTAAAGGLMGQIFANWNDERQLRQQEDLQNIQIRGSKELTDYQMMKQLEMWRNTNYGAQLAEMKKAGLSPGLIYGMKGGGGVTTGNASGSVSGGQAPSGGGEQIQAMGLLQQNALTEAQRRNIDADTKLKEVEAAKREGVDTEKGRMEIASLSQGIKSQQVATELTEIQKRIAGLDETLKGKTLDMQVERLGWETQRIIEDVDRMARNNIQDKATLQDRITTIRGEMLGVFIRNALMEMQTAKTGSDIEVNQQQMVNMAAEIVQDWERIYNDSNRTQTDMNDFKLKEWLQDVQESTKIPMKILEQAVDGIGRGKTPTTTRSTKYKYGGKTITTTTTQ